MKISIFLIFAAINCMISITIADIEITTTTTKTEINESECVNLKSTDAGDFMTFNLTAQCNYFYDSNLDFAELDAIYSHDQNSEIFYVSQINSTTLHTCCDVCFQHEICFLFRFTHATSNCELYGMKSSQSNLHIYSNQCYDMGLTTGK